MKHKDERKMFDSTPSYQSRYREAFRYIGNVKKLVSIQSSFPTKWLREPKYENGCFTSQALPYLKFSNKGLRV